MGYQTHPLIDQARTRPRLGLAEEEEAQPMMGVVIGGRRAETVISQIGECRHQRRGETLTLIAADDHTTLGMCVRGEGVQAAAAAAAALIAGPCEAPVGTEAQLSAGGNQCLESGAGNTPFRGGSE
uniref:Uncharacterized protein n=1 Tax=Octactis speculum TaxID=3111310 RepID=A0A7S2F8M0_9STRA|mmetsp:Transcript_16055/g.21627  ORF Transcript_16055/g.21627 Transcript_16055/m.21627 type:complete len:126 (+) Transcript_16055:158-535(+)